MDRIRVLDIEQVLEGETPRHLQVSLAYEPNFMRHPAPRLESLSYRCIGGLPDGPLLFSCYAPHLKRMILHDSLFHPSGAHLKCQALENITTLSLYYVSSFELNLWLLPRLRTLQLSYLAPYFAIPQLPISHPLRHLIVLSYDTRVGQHLSSAGYGRLEWIEAEGYCADVITNALLASDASYSLTLTATLRPSHLHLRLAPETPHHAGPVVDFKCDGFPQSKLTELFRSPLRSGTFDALTALTIPRDFPQDTKFATLDFFNHGLHRALFPSVPLPRLHTLTLTCGPHAGDALLDPHILELCGVLEAPGLKRLHLARACAGRIEPACPLNLALFIGAHLRVDDDLLAVLDVSPDVGLRDLGDGGNALEVLRSYVATMILA